MPRDDDRSRDRDDDRGSRGRDRDDDRSTRSRGRDDDDRGSRRPSRDDDDRGSRGRKSSFVYEQRDTSELARRAAGGSKYDKYLNPEIKLFKPREGENVVRILPPTWKGAKHYGLDFWVHWGVGADGQTYLCLNKMEDAANEYFERKGIDGKGGEDPIEEYAAQLRRDGFDDEAKEASHKLRIGCYVIDRKNEREGVQFWAMGEGNDRDIVQVSQYKGKPIVIDDPENGYDLTFFRKGTGKTTKYTGWAIDRDPSALGDDRWLDWAMDHPIPDQLIFYTYDHIKKALGGGGSHKGRDDRDDDRPARGRGRDDADDDRGTRGRADSRDDDRSARSSRDDSDRGRSSRDREEEPARGRGRAAQDDPTWESVHDMTERELEDLIDAERLDIDPKEARDVADLADWVCDEMRLKKPDKPAPKEEPRSGRRSMSDDKDDERSSKMAEMRRRRESNDR